MEEEWGSRLVCFLGCVPDRGAAKYCIIRWLREEVSIAQNVLVFLVPECPMPE